MATYPHSPERPTATRTESPIDPAGDLFPPQAGTRVLTPTQVIPPNQAIPEPPQAAGPPAPPSSRIEVGHDGHISIEADDATRREILSEVTPDTFYVNLDAIAAAAREAQANGGQQSDPAKRIFVDEQGNVILGRDVNAGDRVSGVTPDTFFRPHTGPIRVQDRVATLTRLPLRTVDLNAIQRAVRNEGRGSENKIFVTPDGDILLGNELGSSDRMSKVTDKKFWSRKQKEETFARTRMPSGTRKVSDGTYDGWFYRITNEFGDSYELFLYYHSGYGVYRVALISPRLGGQLDIHGGHLYEDGTLCLTKKRGSGYPDMGATYAKSALWTRGASCYLRGYGFQFNIGQD
ncbi:hypothetical protein J5X84_39025 [Streptosporangiaceae bacterium NEAU-GS5]|nr:hypothetical protein [Streptosporangiaceae bacterium NEAU-GS5]